MSHPLPVDQTPASGLHEPFLQRAADADASSNDALGGFLTMRLVDQFARDRAQPAALAYQIRATSDFLHGLYPPTVEGNHLLEIVRVADGVRDTGNVRLLWPPLLAYAYWLEKHLQLPEALDVLETALVVTSGEPGEEEIAARLQLGRVLRLSGRYADARAHYAGAGELAGRLRDTHSVLISRIGLARVAFQLGNLPEAEEMLEAVLRDARHEQDDQAEAVASHDLSSVHAFRGNLSRAVQLAVDAFRMYADRLKKVRALSDVGQYLKELGHYSHAKRALLRVLQHDPPPESRTRSVVELLDLAALMQDRISFERWRREAAEWFDRLPPDEQVELEMKLGRGLAAFERVPEGEEHLRRAIALAEAAGLGEMVFRAEGLLHEIQASRDMLSDATAPPSELEPAPDLQPALEALEESADRPLAVPGAQGRLVD